MRFRVILEKPPAGVDFGIQKGKGSNYETILKQRSDGGDVQFEFEIPSKAGGFSGPIVQGPAGGRFIYVDIGTYAGQHETPWSRRMKIPLDMQPIEDPEAILETRIPGTGRDGGPTCATVKGLRWTVRYP